MRELFAMLVGVVIFVGGFLTSTVVHHLHESNTCPIVSTCCEQCTCEDCDCCAGCCK